MTSEQRQTLKVALNDAKDLARSALSNAEAAKRGETPHACFICVQEADRIVEAIKVVLDE